MPVILIFEGNLINDSTRNQQIIARHKFYVSYKSPKCAASFMDVNKFVGIGVFVEIFGE